MRDFKELKVWRKSHKLALAIYSATKSFPREEMYGLTSQMRRAAISIPANIAEGCGRSSEAELAYFMRIAMGSASELAYYLLLSHDLGLFNKAQYEQFFQDVSDVKKMLTSFVQKLRSDR